MRAPGAGSALLQGGAMASVVAENSASKNKSSSPFLETHTALASVLILIEFTTKPVYRGPSFGSPYLEFGCAAENPAIYVFIRRRFVYVGDGLNWGFLNDCV